MRQRWRPSVARSRAQISDCRGATHCGRGRPSCGVVYDKVGRKDASAAQMPCGTSRRRHARLRVVRKKERRQEPPLGPPGARIAHAPAAASKVIYHRGWAATPEYAMDSPTLAELSDRVPALVKAGIRGLADDERLGLVIALAEGGKMTFSEIKAKYDLDPSTLSGHLNALQSGNLVRNYYEKGIGSAYSYYEATELPEAVIGALLASVDGAEAGEGRPPHPDVAERL